MHKYIAILFTICAICGYQNQKDPAYNPLFFTMDRAFENIRKDELAFVFTVKTIDTTETKYKVRLLSNKEREPRWGRGHETYGEDPYLTEQMGMQFVRGLQDTHPKYLKLVATAKHFAVHNGPEPQRHTYNAVPNTRDLWETYLPAFKNLMVDAKAYSIMGAYNRVDGESASASWLLLEDILRNKWGIEGYVVSDCGAINDIHAHHKIVNTAEESAPVGIRKGCDLNCGDIYQKHLKEAINLGLILAIYRLMLARMKRGMFDPDELVPFAHIQAETNNSKAHDHMALKVAQKSMTLLKNKYTSPQ